MTEHDAIRRDSANLTALREQIGVTYRCRHQGRSARRAWEAACRRYNEFDAPMFAIVTRDGRARIREGDPHFVERAICYLEVDPYHNFSGYAKSALIRCLKGLALDSQQRSRLREVVLHALDSHDRCEIRDYWRLGCRVQTSDFVEDVKGRLASGDARVRSRAEQLLVALDHFNRCVRPA